MTESFAAWRKRRRLSDNDPFDRPFDAPGAIVEYFERIFDKDEFVVTIFGKRPESLQSPPPGKPAWGPTSAATLRIGWGL